MITFTTKPADGLERWYDQLDAAYNEIEAPGGGFYAAMVAGLAQLDRFIGANIEVDTGRTRASLAASISSSAGGLVGALATSVSYAPYVREAGHREPFYTYAEQVEIPGILTAMGRGAVAAVEANFN